MLSLIQFFSSFKNQILKIYNFIFISVPSDYVLTFHAGVKYNRKDLMILSLPFSKSDAEV